MIEELKLSGYINELVSYVGQAIWLNLLFCTVNVVGYFVDHTSVGYSTCWVVVSVASLMAFVRVTHIMLKIFKYG